MRRGGSSDKSQACSLPQSTRKKCLVFVKSFNALSLSILFVPRCPTHSHFQSKLVSAAELCSDFVSVSLLEKGGEGRRVEGEGGGVISSVNGVVSQRHPVAPACSGLTSPHVRTVFLSEGKADHEVGICVVAEEAAGSVRVKAPLLHPSSLERRGRRRSAT